MTRPHAAPLLASLVLTTSFTIASPAADAPARRTDAYGDALPADALFRLGTTRLRQPGGVEALAFSPDGNRLASADHEGCVRVWDADNGGMVFKLPAGTGTAVAFSPGGHLLATGGDQMAVRLWSAADGKEVRTLRDAGGPTVAGRAQAARCLSFSPDGKALLCDDGETDVVLLAVGSGKELQRFQGLKHQAHAIAFSPDGKWVAAGDSVNFARGDATIIVWDALSGEQHCQITDAGQGWIYGLAFTPDGNVLASATPYHVTLWDAVSGKQSAVFGEASGAVAFDAQGKRLFTAGSLCVIDTASHEIVKGMGPGGTVIAASPDGRTVASARFCRVRLWDAGTGKEKLAAGHGDEIRSVAFSPDAKWIATASGGDGTVRLWDAARGAEARVMKLPDKFTTWYRGGPVGLSFLAGGRIVGAAGQYWDVASGKAADEPREICSEHVAFSADGRAAAVIETGEDRRRPVLALRDAATGRLLRRLAIPENKGTDIRCGGLAFSPDGRMLAAGYLEVRPDANPTSAHALRLWDAATGELLQSLCPAQNPPPDVVFSPDGRLVAASQLWDIPPQVWDASTGKLVRKFRGYEENGRHWSEFNPVAFSPDGALLATGGKGNVVVLWETATGGVVRVLQGHARPVRSLAFSPDGRTLVSADADTTALVWPIAPAGLARKWDADKADDLWKALEGDAAAAYPAIWALAAAPSDAAPFLKGRLRPDEAVDERQVARWIQELGDNDFEVRERATRSLRDLGPRVEQALRKALAGQEDTERQRRLGELVGLLEDPANDPALLRDRRAVLALEQMGTPAAKALLEAVARGADGGPRTAAAQAALLRLGERR